MEETGFVLCSFIRKHIAYSTWVHCALLDACADVKAKGPGNLTPLNYGVRDSNDLL